MTYELKKWKIYLTKGMIWTGRGGRANVIRYNSEWQANQELIGIHNDTAYEELVRVDTTYNSAV